MASIWYIGYADVREISSAEWTRVGHSGSTTTWNKSNGWSVPQSGLTAEQIAFLDDLDEFVVTNNNGPRPGAVVTSQTSQAITISDMTEAIGAAALGGVYPVKGSNQSAIMAAIDAASVAGGTVWFPPRLYQTPGPIQVDADNVHLAGVPGKSVIQSTSPTTDILVLGNGTTTRANLGVRGLLLENSSGVKTGGTGIKLNKCFKVWLDELLITQQYRAVHILNSTAVWFNRSDIRNTKENGITVESDFMSGFEWYLNQVLCDNPDVANTGIGLAWLGGESLHVDQCNFQRFGNGFVVSPGAGRECRFGFFDQMLCDFASDNNIKITNSGNGNAVGMEFQNCWSGTATNYGLLVDRPGSGNVQGVKWFGGKVFHNGLAGVRMAGGTDLHILGAEIIGNSQTSSAARHGVEVGGAFTNWSVINCRIGGGYGQGNTQGYAISIDSGAADYYRIIGNDCSTGNNNSPTINDGGTGTHKIVTNNL